MARIDYFFWPISPWTYLAGNRLEEIASRQSAEVHYHPIDLMALFRRTGGLPLRERHQSRIDYRNQDLVRQADQLGMPLDLNPAHWPTNAAPAAYAIIAAIKDRAENGGSADVGALCQAILRACWAEGRDVADDAVLRGCLSASGFDPGLADKGLFTSADVYERNLEAAVARGVFGSPFYIVAQSDQRFWGQDRLADLEAHLASLR